MINSNFTNYLGVRRHRLTFDSGFNGRRTLNWVRRLSAILLVFLAPFAVFAQDKFFDSNGLQINYTEQGTGEAVVLVHGRGLSLQSWIDCGVMPNLAKDYRVIALDCRGFGKSGKPHDPKQYGSEMALDIVRLLDHLGIRKAHIVGYSMGANITAQLLVMHPERFLTAILGGAAGRFQWTVQDDQLFEQEATETEQWGFSPSLALRLAPPDAKPTDAENKRRSVAALANPNLDRHAIAALIRSFREQVISPVQVAAVGVPTMGIAGSADPALESLWELKRLRPEMKLVVIDGATHGGARGVRNRPEFVAAIREFLAAHRP